jgi:hypothetical protein
MVDLGWHAEWLCNITSAQHYEKVADPCYKSSYFAWMGKQSLVSIRPLPQTADQFRVFFVWSSDPLMVCDSDSIS